MGFIAEEDIEISVVIVGIGYDWEDISLFIVLDFALKIYLTCLL